MPVQGSRSDSPARPLPYLISAFLRSRHQLSTGFSRPKWARARSLSMWLMAGVSHLLEHVLRLNRCEVKFLLEDIHQDSVSNRKSKGISQVHWRPVSAKDYLLRSTYSAPNWIFNLIILLTQLIDRISIRSFSLTCWKHFSNSLNCKLVNVVRMRRCFRLLSFKNTVGPDPGGAAPRNGPALGSLPGAPNILYDECKPNLSRLLFSEQSHELHTLHCRRIEAWGMAKRGRCSAIHGMIGSSAGRWTCSWWWVCVQLCVRIVGDSCGVEIGSSIKR